ncbi:redox-regulated ATPase YchF [Megalodesulfovibrio gigas]|uniref:Ribosome-binding ATPase YchF n=1 Tax=Megalodesulfovibrio gigas (strain ATCC 19364 / DSM 1382 / NCIMB 9332 / VKM B-1759) TaxID=1121448 RepID=T2G6H0_MEGG1|nr:redox-regulated ATPase YchF [Megalodesulfovibrio gigas]AGW12165.1 putative GTP-binding protein YchF [Megalodesulfovibrio gigas DSM 1382 = ATCC 19364]
MALGIGIVGLPNVGKSTLFNALTKAQNAQAANYPFCTIEPNKAVTPVPDPRVDKLAELVKPQRIQSATVDFVDIAGLVKGASKGEGLGNKFLANIRECAAILHVVRCFEDDDIAHVDGGVDPLRDIETIETELLLADMQSLENRVDRLQKQAKGDKKAGALAEEGKKLLAWLDAGNPAATYPGMAAEGMATLVRELGLLTAKTMLYACNVDEAGLAADNTHVAAVRQFALDRHAPVLTICARMEEELVGLDEAEREEFLKDAGVTTGGLEQVIRVGYAALGLISYFTAGVKEVRAWTINKGDKAPQAAGVIHSDFERGFIRAEVIAYEDYVTHGTEAKCRAAGVLRVEGKEYVVQDGDVMHFLFNV